MSEAAKPTPDEIVTQRNHRMVTLAVTRWPRFFKNVEPIYFDWHIWTLGVWIHVRGYRYLALGIGPFWIYLFHGAWFDRRRPKR